MPARRAEWCKTATLIEGQLYVHSPGVRLDYGSCLAAREVKYGINIPAQTYLREAGPNHIATKEYRLQLRKPHLDYFHLVHFVITALPILP